MDILVHIQDCKLDNKVAIQLIKDQMQESAHHEVEFQLDLCGGDILYQDLLEHLSIAFQGGDDEANILAEFYSHSQKPKESEEAFADELQLLAHKVIQQKTRLPTQLGHYVKAAVMQTSYMTTIGHQSQRPYSCKCLRSHSHNSTMNWLEFLGLASILVLRLPLNLSLYLL